MYQSYFKFEKSPFKVVPDPSMLFASRSVREALSRLEFAVRTGKGITVMTGEVGTGKTTLVNRFLDKAGPDIQTAYIFNPTLSGLQLLKTLADELGVQTYGMAKVDLTRAVYELLLRNRQAGRRTIVFVDEAQALSREALEELRLLSNLETWQEKLLYIVLVGQPELLEKLESYNLRQLRQRVELFVRIEPMSATETRQYIEHRLRMANPLREVTFDEPACRSIHQIAGGIPRTINIVCDASLLVAFVAETAAIGARHVREAVRTIDSDQVSLRLRRARRARFWHRLWASAAAMLAIVSLGLAVDTAVSPGPRSGATSVAALTDRAAVVHVLSARERSAAERFAAAFDPGADRVVCLQDVPRDGTTWTRVLIGGFANLDEAAAWARERMAAGALAYAREAQVERHELELWKPAAARGDRMVAATAAAPPGAAPR